VKQSQFVDFPLIKKKNGYKSSLVPPLRSNFLHCHFVALGPKPLSQKKNFGARPFLGSYSLGQQKYALVPPYD
jgi:hypothetical protein